MAALERIVGAQDKAGYVDHMINPSRGGIGRRMVAALRIFVETPAVWYCLTLDSPIPVDEFADLWIRRHGEWHHHNGDRMKHHNRLGMGFAWWAMYDRGCLRNIVLNDSPDLRALTLGSTRILGDIGICTPNAALSVLALKAGEGWVSVLDAQTQILIRFECDVRSYWDPKCRGEDGIDSFGLDTIRLRGWCYR